MNPFSLEDHYQFYLNTVELKEEDMSHEQRVETKRAFMAGCAEVLILMTNEIADMDETEAIIKIDSLIEQVQEFWGIQEDEY
jgi:hypothetical protein